MNNLKKYREDAGMSQEDLATKAGCVRSYISQVETGYQKLTLKMAKRFGQFIGATPYQLLGSDAIKYDGGFSESMAPSMRPPN